MVLLENFGAAPLIVKAGTLNCDYLARSLSRKVTQLTMPGIPKFRKESHPERAKDKRGRFYHTPLPPRGAEFHFRSAYPARSSSLRPKMPMIDPRTVLPEKARIRAPRAIDFPIKTGATIRALTRAPNSPVPTISPRALT